MQVSLFHGGKLQGQALTAASVLGRPPPSRFFYIADNVTGTRFLIDTSAEVSVIPPLPMDRVGHHDGLVLRAANDSTIDTFGTRSLTLDLGLEQKVQWIFIVAAVKHPILGVDFLQHYKLLVDVTHQQLIHT